MLRLPPRSVRRTTPAHTRRSDAKRLTRVRGGRRGRLLQATIRAGDDPRRGGDITFGGGTGALRRETRRLIAEGRVDIVLNLAGVRYVDSSGLGEMVAALLAARRAGGQVALLAPTPNVREVFEMTRLVQVFDIYADEPGALRGMAADQN